MNRIIHGDCLVEMPKLADKSIDMILCDLPYGTTACKWDTVIPFEPLWKEYKRLIKNNGAIVLTASQPFTSALVMSNPGWFKYEWIWEKSRATNFLNYKINPAKKHESVLVFGSGSLNYRPIMEEGRAYIDNRRPKLRGLSSVVSSELMNGPRVNEGLRYPGSIIKFKNPNNDSGHPTQKPVALFEYLIRTYTNEGDTVLDNCAGSFTTAIACMNTNRKYICIEKDDKYFEVGKKRIQDWHDKHNSELQF
jgi:site-specific DNA-methyltransferase (adenine-specific)